MAGVMPPVARGVIAGLAAAALFLAAPQAMADTTLGTSSGTTYVTDTLGVTAPDDALVDISCPAGTSATGGGFDSEGAGFFDASALWSFPLATAWRTYQYYSLAGMRTARGYVLCEDSSLRYPEREIKVKAGKTGAMKVSCPDGRHIAGGGGLIQAPPGQARLNSSYPIDDGDDGKRPDDGWKLRALNADDERRFMTVVAVCQKTEPRYVHNAANDLAAGGTGASIPDCRSSEHLIGLGAKLGGSAQQSELHIIQPNDNSSDGDDLPDDGVLANASNHAGKKKRLSAYAICDG
jgi:hypothetical protein